MSVRQRVGISLLGAALAGGVGAATVVAFQPIHHEPASSVNLQHVDSTSTPTDTVTVTPTVDPTTAPAPVATTQAPAPVTSTQAPAPAPAPATTTEAPVSTQPAAAPAPADTTTATAPPKTVAPPNKPGDGPNVPPVIESEPAPSAS